MNTTLSLSQLIGPAVAVVGLSFVLRQKEILNLIKQLVKNNIILWAFGMIELTAGIALTLAHNEWDSIAAILISILGWGMILEGSFGVLANKSHLKRLMAEVNMGMLNPSGVIMVIAGLYLVWNGYLG